MMLNKVSLNTIGLNRIGLNRIGKPSRASSDRPYIDPEVLASLKAVCICYGKSNDDPDRAVVKNLVDPDNPFVISNAAFTEGSGYADKGSPYYGAFVTDGIDDLITSTKTVQEMLGGSNEITVVSMIHQIDGNVNYTNGYTNYIRHGGGFIRNVVSGINGKGFNKTGIYGYTSTQLDSSNMGLGNVINNILGDKDDYSFERSSTYTLDDAKYSVQNFVNANNQPSNESSSVAWYWTIIANKVLTTDQINQVIAYFNLDKTLNPDILCNTIKQGITNENHAEFGDKLIDFSGNGRDIQMYNLAWNGDSGIGDYEVDFTTWNANDGLTVSKNSFSIKSELSSNIIIQSKKNYKAPSFKIKIKGLPKGGAIQYRRADKSGSGYYQDFDSDGDYECMAGYDGGYSSFMVSGDKSLYVGVTVEQISSKIGALCLDGVNDFGQFVGDLGLKDYTLIVDRAYQSIVDRGVPIIAAVTLDSSAPFIFEFTSTDDGNKVVAHSYSGISNTGILKNMNRAITYQSTYKYIDADIVRGNSVGTGNGLTIGRNRTDMQYDNICLYSLLLFRYSMSEFLIERQLKKHKLGTLYPDMVEFRPIVKGGSLFKYLNVTTNEEIFVGDYIHVGDTIRFYVSGISGTANEVSSFTVNGVEGIPKGTNGDLFDAVVTKSPQKINITIDEYIRYEDIVQPYPVLLRFNDENGNEVSWGGKFRVGSTITRIGSIADPESNLLNGLYSVSGLSLNGKAVTSSTSIVEKQMVFKTTATWLLDDNEPKCILSPRLLRIPNSSYKILGHIPDISGHGNHGVIHNSAYAEGSGVNEDGSYQFDGVDDHITIPTLSSGGKQVLMKVNWQSSIAQAMLYDQRGTAFAIWNSDKFNDNEVDTTPAYSARNEGNTYIDGILNKNILASQLRNITHNIVATNNMVNENSVSPSIGCALSNSYCSQMSLYDFMLFDNISTDDKIKELNEYVGIEAKVEKMPYYWDAYGKTNLDADKATIQQRGIAVGDYDLTNYNHAYDKMSGFGGYEFAKFDNTNEWQLYANNTSVDVVSRNGYSITLKRLTNTNFWSFQNAKTTGAISKSIPFKVRANKAITVCWDFFGDRADGSSVSVDVTWTSLTPNEDTLINLGYLTEEEIAENGIVSNTSYRLWFYLPKLSVDEEVTIEMLPLYPNGLVYDRVTDFSKNVNIPAFTDYTYIFKRELLNNATDSCSLCKGDTNTTNEQGFVADYISLNGNIRGYSFGGYSNVPSLNIDKIIYGTKKSVNGTSVDIGSNVDSVGIALAKWKNVYKKMVFYKLILYPKTIPLLQINFLKNMMERDEIIDLNNPIFIQE